MRNTTMVLRTVYITPALDGVITTIAACAGLSRNDVILEFLTCGVRCEEFNQKELKKLHRRLSPTSKDLPRRKKSSRKNPARA